MSDNRKTETCPVCRGDGWLHRQVPSPTSPVRMITVTRVCQYCAGLGKREPLPDALRESLERQQG